MNGCPIDDPALQRLVAELETAPPRPHHSGLLDTAHRALPGRNFRHALSRGGWYRPGGVVRADGSRVADNLEAWVEAQLDACDGDIEAFAADHDAAGLLVTRHSGRTHYFVAPYGADAADFLQLEIEELHEVLDRRLFPADAPPADAQDLIDPLQPDTVEAQPVSSPRYRFRRLTDMRYAAMRLPAPVGQLHPLSRFLAEWSRSQAQRQDHFCDHWIVALREHQDRYRNAVLSAAPVSLHARALKPFHWHPEAHGVDAANQLLAFDRAAGYPGAWYFHMVAGGLTPREIAPALAADLDAGFNYLRDADAGLLVEWLRAPYSA